MTIHNDAMPADIQGTIGLDTEYVSQSFRATALVMLRLKEPIRAIDLRYVLFNAWGEIVDVRSIDLVVDIAPSPGGKDKGYITVGGSGSDRVVEMLDLSEQECRHVASVAYIARIRTADGRIVENDTDAVAREIQKFSQRFQPWQLEQHPATAPTARH